MELKVFWRALGRRWYLTLAIVALAVAATYVVVGRVGPTYEAAGSTLVFPPAASTKSDEGVKTAGNPYLDLAGVSQARDIVIRTLTSKSVRDEWGEEFPGMSYEATPDFTNSAPIILFTIEGGTSAGSVAGLQALMERVPDVLDQLQAGLGLTAQDEVTAMPLTQDEVPETVRKSQIRAGILAATVVVALGLLLLALVDSLLMNRRRAKVAGAAESAQSEVSQPVTQLTRVEEPSKAPPDGSRPEDRKETRAPTTLKDVSSKRRDKGAGGPPVGRKPQARAGGKAR